MGERERKERRRRKGRKTFVQINKWPHEYSNFFLRNNLHVSNRMSSAKDDRDDDNTIDEDEIDDWLDSDDDDGTKKEADEAMPVEDNNNDAVMKQQEQQQLVREKKMKEEEEEEEEEAKREQEDQERKNRERAELEACQAAEITAARKKHEARIRESEKQEEAAKMQRAAVEAAAKEEEEREARHKLEVEKREREEFTLKARAQAEAVELKPRREAESAAVERVRIEEEEEEEEEERGQQQREKELETPKAVFEADKSEQPHASTQIDAVGERETSYPDHQAQNEFDDLVQSSTIVGSLFGGLKALKSAASKTVTTVKTHEFTRQMTSDIRELSRHIAGDDVASSSKTKGTTTTTTTTTTHGENVQNQQQGRTRQSTRDEVDALEIAEKLASKTWHAIGDFTTKGKKLANDVEGSIREKGVGATAGKYGKNALFGIEKVLSNATKVITAGIEDGTNGTSRLAENLQEYGVFEYLDSIDMNTKEAEESFKALDSEAANFMAKACADILSPHVSDEIGSPLKINTNQEFEEMDIHLHEAETSPAKKSGKIHAKKIIDLVQRISMLLKEVMEKPEQNPTKKALSLIEIAENELESTRESVIVGFTELTILACQKFEKVSEELHPKNKMDVSVWGSTVESRAKYVETEIGRIENEMRSFRNVVANEVEALNATSVEQVGEVNISNIPTVSEVVSSFIENVDDDLLECFNIFEDAKGMIIPSIVVSCL